MSDAQSSGSSGRFEVRMTSDSHFGWIRTRLSVERTLMAYMRTSVSLIGFGFAIVQFYDRLENIAGAAPARYPDAARWLGLTLILCGVAAQIVSILEFRWTIRYLWSGDYAKLAGMTKQGRLTPLYPIALALIAVGTWAFFTVLLRLV
jgi:putative membrane protein